ncbi:MAG: hypothetical protein EHM72_06965 [Calditrichaeota bacterium]|nr:MAG: hypothetical protein EHM72_06965 [Calditrichota bacterium]
MFKWTCALKNKGKTCIRKFNHIGRLCEGCSHFLDEKIHYQPRIVIDNAAFERFQQEIEEFDEWVAEHRERDLDIWCRVRLIKPRFRKIIYGAKAQLRLEGYLLVSKEGFIGLTPFDDYFYAYLTPQQQDRLRISANDTFDARGRMKLDRGRVLFSALWAIQIQERSGGITWNNSRALVAKNSAVELSDQPESCLHCPYGALADVVIQEKQQNKLVRTLYCLEGYPTPEVCGFQAMEMLDRCHKKQQKME